MKTNLTPTCQDDLDRIAESVETLEKRETDAERFDPRWERCSTADLAAYGRPEHWQCRTFAALPQDVQCRVRALIESNAPVVLAGLEPPFTFEYAGIAI